MGTNYYAKTNICKHCNRGEDNIHIGKSSMAWRFAVEIHEDYYKTFSEFLDFLDSDDIEIVNEYGKKVTFKELHDLIEAKCVGKSHFDGYPDSKYADCNIVDLYKGGFS